MVAVSLKDVYISRYSHVSKPGWTHELISGTVVVIVSYQDVLMALWKAFRSAGLLSGLTGTEEKRTGHAFCNTEVTTSQGAVSSLPR